jgi:hypothetical protein
MFSSLRRAIGGITPLSKTIMQTNLNKISGTNTFFMNNVINQHAPITNRSFFSITKCSTSTTTSTNSIIANKMLVLNSKTPYSMNTVRNMNRNARRPKKANHGKRPVCHARRREKAKSMKSRLYRQKAFGFW